MDLEHEKRLVEVEQRSKSNTHRLEDVERRQDDLSELVGTVKVLAEKEDRMESDVKEIKSDVKILTNKPAKRWDNLIDKIISLLIAGVVGFFLAKLGM